MLLAHGYRPLECIGIGAFGQVWLVIKEGDEGFRLPQAVKLFTPRDVSPASLELSRELFVREAKLLAGLRHENIVRVTDLFSAPPYLGLVMDYVEGLVLSTYISFRAKREQPTPSLLALQMAARAARGLHEAHSLRDRHGKLLNLLHQDVKPSNIILGVTGTIHLLDFGVAGLFARPDGSRSHCVGTPQYMSPEQATGAPLSPMSDLYSLGLILYEMLALKPLIPETTFERQMEIAATLKANDSVTELEPKFPDAARFLRWMLQSDPVRRPVSGEVLADEIDNFLSAQPRRVELKAFARKVIHEIRAVEPSLLPKPLDSHLAELPATRIVNWKRGRRVLKEILESQDSPDTRTLVKKEERIGWPNSRRLALGATCILLACVTLLSLSYRYQNASEDNSLPPKVITTVEPVVAHPTSTNNSTSLGTSQVIQPSIPPSGNTKAGRARVELKAESKAKPSSPSRQSGQSKPVELKEAASAPPAVAVVKTEVPERLSPQRNTPARKCRTTLVPDSNAQKLLKVLVLPKPSTIRLYCEGVEVDLSGKMAFDVFPVFPGKYEVRGEGNGSGFRVCVDLSTSGVALRDPEQYPCP